MQHILDVNLPEQNPQGAPGGDFQRIDSNPNMFGALGAKAEQQLGQGIEKAGNTGIEIATEQNQIQNKLHAADVKSWYADQTTDLHTKFMSLSGRAALDALPEYKKNLGDLRGQALDKVSSPQSKAMLNESLTTMQDQYYRYWAGHAGGQLKTYQDKVAQDSIASSSALAVNSLLAGDELGFERRLREQDAEVHNLFDGQGYDKDAMGAEVAKRRGTTLKVAIETVAAGGDVAKAQALFDKYKDRMDPASVLAVTANLKSGVAALNGRNIADEESGHVLPKADAVAGVPSSFIAQVKRTEGFAAQAKWDVKQFSNGYGTRAKFDGETISKEEAEQRFQTEFAKAAKIVDSVNPNLDPGTRAALASLTYNAGDAWTHAGLGEKIRSGDLAGAKELFLQYNKADGQTNEGLTNRRYREAQWFGSNDAPAGNGPLVDKQSAYERVLARTDSNPLLQSAAISRLNQVYGIYHTEQTSQNAAFDRRLEDSQAEALATGTTKAPLTEPDFVNRYGVTDGRRQYGEYQKNIALGADIAGLATMSPEEQKAVLDRHTPVAGSEGFAAEGLRQQAIQKAIAHATKERNDDPAAYAIRRLPAAQTAFAEFSKVMADNNASPDARRAAAAQFANVTLAEQARIGVAPDDRRIVPQPYIDNLNSSLAAPDQNGGTSQVAQKIEAEASLWGKNWPGVYRQLSKEAAPVVRVIGSGVQPAAAQILVDLAPLSLSAILKDEDTEKSASVKKEVLDAFKPLAASMAGNDGATALFNDFRGQAEKLAAKYVIGGAIASEAAVKAWDQLVGFKYTFQDGYRVPKDAGVDPAAIAKGSVAALQGLGKFDRPDAQPAGRIDPGNIDLDKRPVVKNADGSISTVRTIGVNIDGKEVLLPTVSDAGKIVTPEEAIETYRKTGKHLGTFDTPEHATAFAKNLHESQAAQYAHPLAIAPAADTMGGLSSDYLRESKARALRRDGKWVTSPDEKGLMLVHNDQAVRRPDGSALMLTWRQLGDFAAEERRAAAAAPPLVNP